MILPPYRATPKHPVAREENSSGTHSSVLPLRKKNWDPSKLIYLQSPFFYLILKYDYVICYRSIRVSAIGLSTAISVNELLSNFVTVLLYVLYSLSYSSDYLTRSDSTDCKRIQREENTYCNRLHYHWRSWFCTFSASEESQITKRPCKPLCFSVFNDTIRALVAGVYYLVIIVKDSAPLSCLNSLIIKINFMGKLVYFEMNFLSI